MISLGVSREVQTTVSSLWPIIGKFSALPEWFPNISHFECDGDAPGAERRITIGPFVITQRLLEQDDAMHMTKYQVTTGPGMTPETGFIVTIIVDDIGGGRARINWSAQLDALPSMLPPGSEAAFIQRTERNYNDALDHFEALINAAPILH